MRKSQSGIRELEKRDIHACTSIVRENWGEEVADRFWDEVQHAFLRGMKWPPEYFVYEEDGDVVAFAGMMESWQMHRVMDFVWINVKEEYQGRGYGRALTQHRIERCKKYDIRVINLITRRPMFFEQFGFKSVYAYEGEFWHSMTLQLGSLALK